MFVVFLTLLNLNLLGVSWTGVDHLGVGVGH